MRKIRKLISAGLLLLAIVSSIGNVQALNPPFTLFGRVNDTDGITPVNGVLVNVTHLATGNSLNTTTSLGGFYSVNLGNMPNTPNAGDSLQIKATIGNKIKTTVVQRAAISPQRVDLVLTEDKEPPVIISATANPANIIADGVESSLLNVTVTDNVAIDSVIVNLSSLGGSPSQELVPLQSTNLWQVSVNTTKVGTFILPVNVTDISGNYNTTSIMLNATSSTKNFTINLITGYNLISLPLNDTSVTTASTLASKIGTNVTELEKWDSNTQQFVSFVPGVPLNDFNVAGGEGYFVNVNGPTMVKFSGNSWAIGGSFSMSLKSNYNLISLPLNDSSVTTASTLASKIGTNVTEMEKWDSNAQQFVSFVPGVPLNNFNILGGEGYFVNLNNPTVVVFTGNPWSN